MFSKFTIYGERCSGTNYLAKLLHDNFTLDYVFLPNSIHGSKHWFGDVENIKAIKTSSDCMILSVIRNPIDWIMSFFNNPHQQAESRTKDLITFISTEFYSTLQSTGEELELCRYRDIFDARRIKSAFLYHLLELNSNSCFVKYEEIKSHPVQWLMNIEYKFGLIRKHPTFFIEKNRIVPQNFQIGSQSNQIKGTRIFEVTTMPIRENYDIPNEHAKIIIKNRLNLNMESVFGYDASSIMSRLI